MKRKHLNKNRGFTLVEFVLAILIFSTITVGFLSSMFVLYKNSKDELEFSKSLYKLQDQFEMATSIINDQELEPNDKLSAATLEQIFSKTNIEPKYVNGFSVFSGEYECNIDGYVLSKESKRIGQVITVFLSNDNKSEITFPEIINQYITGVSVVPEYRDVDYITAPEFIYSNTDYLNDKNSEVKGYYVKDGTNYGVEVDYSYKEGTDITSFYDRFRWYYCDELNDMRAEPIFQSLNGYKIPEEAYASYPAGLTQYKDTGISDRLATPTKILDISATTDAGIKVDHYLSATVVPKTLTNINIPPSLTEPIWVINLPVTRSLVCHFDATMEGEFLGTTSSTTETNWLRNLFTVFNNTQEARDSMKRAISKDGSRIIIHKDERYGKYFKTKAVTNKLIRYISYRDDFDPAKHKNNPDINTETHQKGEMTLFMIVGEEATTIPGAILTRLDANVTNNLHCQVSLDSSGRYTFKGGTDVADDSHTIKIAPNSASNKHIIIAKVDNTTATERSNYLAVDSLNFTEEIQPAHASNSEQHKMRRRVQPVMIGGANDLRIYEVIEYEYALKDDEIEDVFKYLKAKHMINY